MTENRPKAELERFPEKCEAVFRPETRQGKGQEPAPPKSGREDRLAEALRANLARRKAQDRARKSAPDKTAVEPKE